MQAKRLSRPLSAIQRQLAGKLRAMTWTVRGTDPESPCHFSMLYLGSESEKNYLASLIFGDTYEETYHGRTWMWGIYRILRNQSCPYSLVIIQGSDWHRKLYQRAGDFYIPSWVGGELEIPFKVTSLAPKWDLRTIRRAKLEFIVTNGLDHYNYFYHKMYLPYITKRYGNTVLEIIDYDTTRREVESGVFDLLLIKKGDEYISGMLIQCANRVPRLHYTGVKDGDPAYLKDGALAATYYFACEYLQQRGYDRVNVGGSRAFLRDGVLNYKKKWGLRLTDAKSGFLLKVLSPCPSVRRFFLENPFIYLDGKEFCGAFFCENNGSELAETLRKVDRYSAIRGISFSVVYKFGENKKDQTTQFCCVMRPQ